MDNSKPASDQENTSPGKVPLLPEGFVAQPYFYFPPFFPPNYFPIGGVPAAQQQVRLTPCRNGDSCIFLAQGRCKFYHGPPLPNSPPLRRKPCRFGDTCKYFEQGICNFYHPPRVDNLPDEDGKPKIEENINQEENQNGKEDDEEQNSVTSKSPS